MACCTENKCTEHVRQSMALMESFTLSSVARYPQSPHVYPAPVPHSIHPPLRTQSGTTPNEMNPFNIPFATLPAL